MNCSNIVFSISKQTGRPVGSVLVFLVLLNTLGLGSGLSQLGNFTAMISDLDGGDADDGGGNLTFPPLLRSLAKGAVVTLGGIFSITVISSTAITLFTLRKKAQFGSSSSSSIKKKNASSCDVCREKGFYMCKLCKGNATIEWSPLYDPVFINPCLCPTCDGQRIQRCLNCLGSGFIQQAQGCYK